MLVARKMKMSKAHKSTENLAMSFGLSAKRRFVLFFAECKVNYKTADNTLNKN
jgi:hypothetical protein